MGSFFSEGDGTDRGYVNVRDAADGICADGRAYTELLWRRFSDFADSQFLREAKDNFTERFWEMYLGCTLIDCGYEIGTPGDEGPDLFTHVIDKFFWFEATASSAGTKDDQVPKPTVGEAGFVPEDKILLRLTNAIDAKLRQIERAQERGIVSERDGALVCINGRQIPNTTVDAVPPLIVQAVLAIGNPQITLDRYTMQVISSGFEKRPHLKKASGTEISTRGFVDGSLARISAVIYSHVDCVNHPPRLGDDFLCVHNPYAIHPLPIGFLGRGVEYWVQEDNKLMSKDFSVK
ncbi:MAG: hypothetical protein F4Y34_01580 [Gammaproteobacteria bacterium]|nr:hypothetical protein [Gammaproteobacteria bacterium]MYH85855.1 hypothetical protein [Gammaproteobacteria bacterium]